MHSAMRRLDSAAGGAGAAASHGGGGAEGGGAEGGGAEGGVLALAPRSLLSAKGGSGWRSAAAAARGLFLGRMAGATLLQQLPNP